MLFLKICCIIVNLFQPTTRIQIVKQSVYKFALCPVDEDKRILLFKSKSCFLYRM